MLLVTRDIVDQCTGDCQQEEVDGADNDDHKQVKECRSGFIVPINFLWFFIMAAVVGSVLELLLSSE